MHAVAFGEPLGFSEEQLHSTVHGAAGDPCWNAAEATVFRLADELHETGTLSDALWDALSTHFDEEQILELIVTAGWYHLIGFVCNGVALEPEPWAARFPVSR